MDPRDELFRLDPEAFVAARDALAKELRAAGDRDTAAAVKQLRRPTVAVWALNQVAARDPDVVAELRDATQATKDADDLRAALARRRDAINAVVRAARDVLASAGRASEAQDRAVEDALNRIAGSDALLSQFAAGTLTALEGDDADDVGALLAASSASAASSGTRRAKGKAKPTSKSASKAHLEVVKPAGPSPALRAARKELERREREAVAAGRAVEAAQHALEQAEHALERAREDVARHERES